MGKHAESVDSQILARIEKNRKGGVFTPTDALDLGSRRAVGFPRMHLDKSGAIQRMTRGLHPMMRAK